MAMHNPIEKVVVGAVGRARASYKECWADISDDGGLQRKSRRARKPIAEMDRGCADEQRAE